MYKELIYLDTYVLQKDMRIRLPKSILTNLNLEKGISKFDIYFDREKRALVLKVVDDENKQSKRGNFVDEKIYK